MSVLYVYRKPEGAVKFPILPARDITQAEWDEFSPYQKRQLKNATVNGEPVWVHIDLVDETEQERLEREAAEQAAREEAERRSQLLRVGVFEDELATVVPGPGEVIVGGADGPVATPDKFARGHEFGFLPLANVSTIESPTVRPIGAIGGTLYGASGVTLRRSVDDGETWETVHTFTGVPTVSVIRQMGNGEVVVGVHDGVMVSSGWATNPLTATWTRTLTTTSGGGFAAGHILPWGLKAYDLYVLVSEYTNPRNNSKKVWFSQDYGHTFVEVLNLDTLYPGQEAQCHWHGVEIDPWANTPSGIRLWASNGDGPTVNAQRYSDDLGATWTVFSNKWQFTTLTATPAGLVCGTDDLPDGVYRVLRMDNPAEMVVEPMHLIWRGGPNTLYGFSRDSVYHEDTGLVYLAFRSDLSDHPAYIFVSDGYRASQVYESPWRGDTTTPTNIAVVDDGSVHMTIVYGEVGTQTWYRFQSDRAVRGVPAIPTEGRGGQLVGVSGDKTSIAIGGGTEINALRSVALGVDVTIADDSVEQVAIGEGAATTGAGNGTAVGAKSSAAQGSVAVGRGTKSTSPGSVAVGLNADGSGSLGVAVGNAAKSTGPQTTAVGDRAEATGTLSTAFGSLAKATLTNSLAVGPYAQSTHTNSVALGTSTVTTTSNQVALGARSLEIGVAPVQPAAPGADAIRPFVRVNASNKLEFCVRFPTGAIQVIATEP